MEQNARWSRPALVSFLLDIKSDSKARFRLGACVTILALLWISEDFMSALILAAYAALILGSVALACDLVFMLKKYLNVSAFTLSFLATYLIITLGSALIIDRPKAVILLLLPSILVANLVGSRVPKNGRTLNKAAEEVEGGE